jgi:peptide/nickel transport system substrate-binding protein
MRKVKKRFLAAIGVLAVALLAAACGSSSSSGGSNQSAPPSAVPTSGVGLTSPYTPSGTKQSGGTVYFTQGSQAPPNGIFPMYSFAYCSTVNIDQLMDMLYRPLYWYGDKYRPTVDYNRSIGQKPVFNSTDTQVTVHLNPYKWSDGEPVDASDIIFWLNMMKADPATEWCAYAPGYMPDLIKSYTAPNPSTIVLTFDKAYDPEWVLYNVLSEITPIPLAWDRTSLAGCPSNGNCPTSSSPPVSTTSDSSTNGAAVYNFLQNQGKNSGGWASSPLWSIVDGPFTISSKLGGSFTSSNQVTLVPNPSYSGSPKPTISKFVELPFTSEAAIYNTIRSGGPSAVTVGSIPAQYAPQIGSLTSMGYVDNKAGYYGFNYFPINYQSNATTSPGGEPVRYIFDQLYFRQALQHLIDQQGWIKAYLNNTASPTCGPIPITPPSPLVNTSAISFAPCTYSISDASKLLSNNGWKVVANGTTTCQDPAKCGTGIQKGEGISFNVDYLSGVVSTQDEMNQLAANAKQIGITISLTTHPFASVISAAVPCKPSQASCKWTANNWGAGWIYGPDYLPTGEWGFIPGAASNAGTYSNPQMTSLIKDTITGPLSGENKALTSFANFAAQNVPVIYGPTSLGTYGAAAGIVVDSKLGGYAANALGFLTPEDWYFVK